jgi:hypothetical protein
MAGQRMGRLFRSAGFSRIDENELRRMVAFPSRLLTEPEPELEMLSPPPGWAPMVEVLLVVVDEVAVEAIPAFGNQADSLTAGRLKAAAGVASLATAESALVLDFLCPFFERLGAFSGAAASSCQTCNLAECELQ